MQIYRFLIIFFLSTSIAYSCLGQTEVLPGAHQINDYLPQLKNKNVGMVVNHTSLIGKTHLVDSLLKRNISIAKIFSPEHGFRGNEDAGALIDNGKDVKTGLSLVSLYGSSKKPKYEDLVDIDILVFDLQDVGVRFFTYISTLYYVMEACAEHNIPLIVLDRPNPNGDYIAGPVLDMNLKSFVGIVPIPIVYGLSIGELASMINGEGWLTNGMQCSLEVVPIKNWNHAIIYELPVKPSPNLPNYQSVRLYPSLCIFEGTNVSVGRGTFMPFQVVGYPDSSFGNFSFTPISIKGMSSNPKHINKICYGYDLRTVSPPKFSLDYFYEFYEVAADKSAFLERPEWIELLIGDSDFIERLKEGYTDKDFTAIWEKQLSSYKIMRKKYLLYPDF